MLNKRFSALALIVVFVVSTFVGFGFNAAPALAQDQDEEGPIVCDWTLITLLYIAEHEYGYFPMTDVSNFDFGQYTPLFDAMMAEMEMEATAEPEMEATEEAEMEATEEPEMEATEEPPYTFLPHGDIEGEPQPCEDLRHELDAYFLDHFMHEMEMGMGDE